MGYLLKQNQTTRPLLFLLVQTGDHITPATGLTPTVTISKNGGSFASPVGALSEVGSGWYKVAPNASDTNTLGPMLLHATGTGADPTDVQFEVVAYNPEDAVALGLTRLDVLVSSRTTLGAGGIAFTYTLTRADNGQSIGDAEVWATTDANGLNIVASGRTNSFGQVTFNLDAGTYYVWRRKSGYTFTNPDTEVVS